MGYRLFVWWIKRIETVPLARLARTVRTELHHRAQEATADAATERQQL